MNTWQLLNLSYISEGSENSNNIGQTPLTAKYHRTFVNKETGLICSTTDLQSKIYKRDKNLKMFFQVYKKYLRKKTHSVICAVVNQDKYETVTKFINTISRKLKRKGINRLGYLWVRDVGDIRFHKHFHVIIATTRISAVQFKELFSTKNHNHYDVEFLKTPKGMANYISEKSLYAAKKQRSYGKSRNFPVERV